MTDIVKKGDLDQKQSLSVDDVIKLSPWGETMCLVNQLLTQLFQSTLNPGQTKLDAGTFGYPSSDGLQEAMTSLMKTSQSLVSEIQSLLEDSCHREEHISKLPLENTCWYIGDWEYSSHVDCKVLRLMTVLDISSSQPATHLVSIAYKLDQTYEEQAMQLLCRSCLHPARKCPRRPFFVKLFDTPEARGFVLDVARLGVHFLSSETSVNLEWNNLAQESHIWFRRCFHCGLRGTPDMFINCSRCKVVVYCDSECQMESWKSHHKKKWCEKCSTFMKMELQLADLPFTFSSTSTSQHFTKQKFISFLEENDVYRKGLWRRECPVAGEADACVPFGELLSPHSPYALPLESAVLESAPAEKEPLSGDRLLEGWSDYYNYRGFWFDSPIAGLLHYPLTLYWIVVYLLPQHNSAVFQKMKLSNSLHVHIIGAEKEAEMFDSFLECARLLSPADIHLHLFGDQLSTNVHDKCLRKENLTFQVHCGLYHNYALHELPNPDLVVGFNAGLSAYSTFILTVKLLLENETHLYCTDYCSYSIAHSQKALSSSHIGRILQPVINPFRSPFRLVAEDMNLPRYSNAFVYCVKPWKPSRNDNGV